MRQEQYNLALEVLSASDWLKDYPEALVRQLVAEGRLVRLNVGEWAQAEGDDRSGLFVVIDGSLHSFCAAPGGRAVMIGVVGAGAGGFHSSWTVMNDAVWLKDEDRTVEGFAARWEEINSFTNLIAPQSGSEQSGNILRAMQKVTGTGPASARG